MSKAKPSGLPPIPAAPAEPAQSSRHDAPHWLFQPRRTGERVNEHVRYERPAPVLDLLELSRILRGGRKPGPGDPA